MSSSGQPWGPVLLSPPNNRPANGIDMIGVILSGGSGTRLWPLSRKAYPKQFLSFESSPSMLQQTVLRAQQVTENQNPLLVCNEDHRFLVAEQLRELSVEAGGIILEPAAKNTAPAIAAAATYLLNSQAEQDPLMLVMPADHVIENVDAFKAAVETARSAAEQGKLVTFGIVPDSPETGYGYINKGDTFQPGVYDVARFVEKPDLATAREYVQSKAYFWNSGMFLFKASSFLSELEKYHPDMLSVIQKACRNSYQDLDFVRLDRELFEQCPADSIDYAVMERSDEVVVVPMDANWNDIGSWSAIWDVSSKNHNGNTVIGDVIDHDSKNCYFHSSHKLIATIGLDNVVAVETADAVLIANKDRVQDVKAIVDQLNTRQRSEPLNHRKVYRPWGYYDSIDSGDRFQVKRIVVDPGQKLSLQMHHHRTEHWVVVKGTARVTCGEDQFLVGENESTYIPLGTTHRLENPGNIPLEMIEIQSGSYLGEDDIVRFSDDYGRDAGAEN